MPERPAPAHHSGLRSWIAVSLFTATIFLSSALLFLVQPMIARLVLPRLGGSPSVWNTCMVFFQAALLLGYVYADVSTRLLGVRKQAPWHLVFLLLPLLFLPLTLGAGGPPSSASPVWWLLTTMTLRAGVPFFAVSASAPLLQRWFAILPLSSARDPYFLYAASNAGSMLALFAYPFLLEPSMAVTQQMRVWAIGYLVLLVLLASCSGVIYWFGRDESPASVPRPDPDPISLRDRLVWVAYAFVPSSLMLGVTTHISAEIAAVPLLWVIPLALYLATFIVAFSSGVHYVDKWLVRLLPVFVLGALGTVLVNVVASWPIAVHLAALFTAALACHRELARRRPTVQHLTEYYIWLSVGGLLGGVLNSLIAPHLFSRVLEYPLMLAAVATMKLSSRPRRLEPGSPSVLIGLPVVLLALGTAFWTMGLIDSQVGHQPLVLATLLALAIGYMAYRAETFAATALMAVAAIAFVRPPTFGTVLFAGRSFFGIHRVIDAPDHSYHLLQHGVTTHGRQQVSASARCEQTGYYHPSGPVGQVFRTHPDGFTSVAVIGLGTGALACYAGPDDSWTFFEIDPMVERIARDTRYFTYLANSPARLSVRLGDGRLTLQTVAPSTYDLLVVDAFSSDAIPVHLLTREAVDLYFSRLKPDGILALHISNRYLDLEPVIGAIAQQQHLFALANADANIPEQDLQVGRMPSHWVVLARTQASIRQLLDRPGWRQAATKASVTGWSDEYSNILRVMRF